VIDATRARGQSARVDLPELLLRPIGVLRTPFTSRVQAPRQPRAAEGVRGTIELLPGHHFEDALADLEGWQYVWVIFWFHLNHGYRPKVLPPRSTRRRGLFSTRSPHRPNPLGLSVFRLERVEGRVVHVSDVDVLDGTPVLDLKPYVPWTDAITDARAGWLEDEAARPSDPVGDHVVVLDPHATAQLESLGELGRALEDKARQVLALGPQPHAYRRIRPNPDGTATLAVQDWRVRFRSEGKTLVVFAVQSGYRREQLLEEGREVHRAFVARWGPA